MTGFETFRLPDDDRAELHACLARSLPAPIGYYRALVRPLRTFAARRRALAVAAWLA